MLHVVVVDQPWLFSCGWMPWWYPCTENWEIMSLDVCVAKASGSDAVRWQKLLCIFPHLWQESLTILSKVEVFLLCRRNQSFFLFQNPVATLQKWKSCFNLDKGISLAASLPKQANQLYMLLVHYRSPLKFQTQMGKPLIKPSHVTIIKWASEVKLHMQQLHISQWMVRELRLQLAYKLKFYLRTLIAFPWLNQMFHQSIQLFVRITVSHSFGLSSFMIDSQLVVYLQLSYTYRVHLQWHWHKACG